MSEKILVHNCLEHLDKECRCTVCGNTRHAYVSDDNGSGTGLVTDRCKRCGSYERWYGDTGTVIESTFENHSVNKPISCDGKK